MKTPRATKLLALFLAFVFSLYLVPTEVLAAEIGSQSAVQAEIDTETAAEENPEIVTELAEGRGRFQKEYLLSNGQRMLAVYPTAVHYEEDGEWKEIDNFSACSSRKGHRRIGSTLFEKRNGIL